MNLKTFLAAVAALTLLSAGCSGGGGGDDDDDGGSASLSNGTYVISNASITADGCQFGITATDLNGQTFGVTVNGNTVTLDLGSGATLDLTLSGTDLSASQSGNGQIATDCTADLSITDSGSVTANDVFHLSESIAISNPTGAGCAGLPATFPCTTSYSFDATKQ